MRRTLAIAAALLALPLLAAACGDGPDAPAATPTQRATATPTTAGDPAWPGPPPNLGTNVTAITPTHGQRVTQLDTRSPDPTRPRGVCFQASFDELPENALWFRMAVDDREVTTEITWIVATRENPEGGRACYAPAEGLAPGRHTAAVSVQNPNNPNDIRELVAWAFEVTP
jgi:hypothetical protein